MKSIILTNIIIHCDAIITQSSGVHEKKRVITDRVIYHINDILNVSRQWASLYLDRFYF